MLICLALKVMNGFFTIFLLKQMLQLFLMPITYQQLIKCTAI